MTAFTSRPFAGESDFHLLIDFAHRRMVERWPEATYWHPGDIVWQLYRAPQLPEVEDIRLWFYGEELAGFAAFEAPLRLQFDVAAAHESSSALMGEIIEWAEARRRAIIQPGESVPIAYADLGQETLATSVLDSDPVRVRLLERLGYVRKPVTEVRFAMVLSSLPPLPDMQGGYRARHATSTDVEERAELHRDAWSVWGLSPFTARAYTLLREAPLYDEELDIVTEAPGGGLVSYCLCWLDKASCVATLEPTGTRPSHTGRGLARFTILAALHRARDMGAHTALVSTAGVNAGAQSLYARCGFAVTDSEHFYVKRVSS